MYGFQVLSRVSLLPFVSHLFINVFSVSASIWISRLNQDQTWEFSHPKFIRGRPDLLLEIKPNGPELYWNPAMNDEVELPGDVGSLISVYQRI